MAGASADNVGFVYLVGAGPGDPRLITLRGADCLRIADVIVYDALANPELLELAPAHAERVPVGRRHGQRCMPQEEINEVLVSRARSGRTVVRLKGGDPFVFGRGGEEAAALAAAGVPFEVVPGVTAGVGVPAFAGIPVTHRGVASAVAFVTGHEDPGKPDHSIDWSGVARFPGTLVFFMGVSRLAALAEALMRNGKDGATPVAAIERGTTTAQRTVTGTLNDIADRVQHAGLCAPAIVVVGQVVSLGEMLGWFDRKPLFGLCIVITRPRHQSVEAVDRLASLGAEVLALPAIRIEPPSDWGIVDRSITSMDQYDWLVFTSANGVQFFLTRVFEIARDVRVLGRVKIAAIGEATARELERFSLRPDLVPTEANSESLVDAFRELRSGAKLLLLRADRAREALPDGLRAGGIPFDEVAVYRTLDEATWDEGIVERLARGDVDWITITSPLTVRSLVTHLPARAREQLGKRTKVASISRLTSAAARELGVPVAVEPATASMHALVDAVVEWVKGHGRAGDA